MKTPHYLPQVRAQYEELPYPARNPQDEKTRLARTWLEDLPMINHYCFAGRQSFRKRFRALVAGGGTGDATIFLAEQLRHTDAEIVHLDMSRASSDIALKRAQIRGLTNITWIHDSVLALPELALEPFDYVNCSGVLHHMEDPDAGLRALLTVLKESGALGIMVYGRYGRTGIYQMQALMRLINDGIADTPPRIRNAREVLGSLPPTNWFRRAGQHFEDLENDAGIYDLFLHAQDRPYTVGELYEWIQDRHGLHLHFTDVGRGRAAYMPELLLNAQQPAYLSAVCALPERRQHEIAELLSGDLITHSFYVTRTDDTEAAYADAECVPCFYHEPLDGAALATLIRQHQSKPFVVNHSHTRIAVQVDPGKYSAYVLPLIDGKRSFREIFALLRAQPQFKAAPPTDEDLFRDLQSFFQFLRAIDRVLLRHSSVDAID